ncbi:MAG: PIN domain-containing protein, partial [Opitutae bacterium]|nr:PIN domain-containing protein [Opitutae bacterium]
MKPYADTNFLLRVYLDYEETEAALSRVQTMHHSGSACPVSWLHRIEYANALQLILFQSRSGGRPHLTPEAAAVALHDFDTDLKNGGVLREAGLPAPELARKCQQLSARHTATLGCRTYDLIHVTAAILLECDTFWSFDAKAS